MESRTTLQGAVRAAEQCDGKYVPIELINHARFLDLLIGRDGWLPLLRKLDAVLGGVTSTKT